MTVRRKNSGKQKVGIPFKVMVSYEDSQFFTKKISDTTNRQQSVFKTFVLLSSQEKINIPIEVMEQKYEDRPLFAYFLIQIYGFDNNDGDQSDEVEIDNMDNAEQEQLLQIKFSFGTDNFNDVIKSQIQEKRRQQIQRHQEEKREMRLRTPNDDKRTEKEDTHYG